MGGPGLFLTFLELTGLLQTRVGDVVDNTDSPIGQSRNKIKLQILFKKMITSHYSKKMYGQNSYTTLF